MAVVLRAYRDRQAALELTTEGSVFRKTGSLSAGPCRLLLYHPQTSEPFVLLDVHAERDLALIDDGRGARVEIKALCFLAQNRDELDLEMLLRLRNGVVEVKLECDTSAAHEFPIDQEFRLLADFPRPPQPLVQIDAATTTVPILRLLGFEQAFQGRQTVQWGFRRVSYKKEDGGEARTVHLPEARRVVGLRRSDQRLRSFQIRIDDGDLPQDPRLLLVQTLQIPGDVAGPLEAQPSAWILRFEGIPSASVRRFWNVRVAAPFLRALRTVRSGMAISVMPFFDRLDLQAGWTLVLRLAAYERLPSEAAPFLERVTQSLQPRGRGTAEARLEGLRDHDGRELRWQGEIRNRHPLPSGSASDESYHLETGGLVFEIGSRPAAVAGQPVRMGALDLTLDGSHNGASTARERRAILTFRPERVTEEDALPRFTIDAELAVRDVAPGGQDDLPGEEFVPEGASPAGGPASGLDDPAARDRKRIEAEIERNFRRDPPLVIPVPGAPGTVLEQAPPAPSYTLRATEAVERGRSQTLRLQILSLPRAGEGPASRDFVILDRQPLLVALVEVPFFQGQRGDSETAEIGNWSNSGLEGANWEIQGSREGFTLRLPPQAVGEAAEKGSRGDGYHDVEEGRPIPFRFSPTARFELLPSFFEQRFAEAPWNLRRLLGFPGQRAPGAGVLDLRFELLYGLTCRVDAGFLRLAEVSARLGHVPGRLTRDLPWESSVLDQRTEYLQFRRRWSEVYARYLSRLAVLEPWDSHQPEGLVLDEGLAYEIRDSARLLLKVRGVDAFSWREGPGQPPDPGALAGGLAWGIEFPSIYNALRAAPRSTSGRLAQPRFSALGGWGYQKAAFHNDLIRVYSDTAMGRCSYYSLEVLGRIGVYWNPAKYVVVYERAVVRERQFEHDQDALRGVPVLRKVKEYVEILEPERRYPDFGAPPVTRGFVQACEFKSQIINVSSAWGRDLGDGFEIPLWNPLARPADVFPKPHVVLHLAADPESGPPTECADLEEPQNLFFYANLRTDADSRPELWPAKKAVDFPDLPTPRPPDVPAFDPGNLDRRLPDAAAVEPGFDRFTFVVAPAPRLSNLVAERTDQALGARVRNVTMVRAIPRVVEGAAPLADAAAGLGRVAGYGGTAVQELIARLPRTEQEYERVKDVLGAELRRVVAGLQGGEVGDRLRNDVARLRNVAAEIRDRVGNLPRQFEQELTRGRGELEERVHSLARQLKDLPRHLQPPVREGLRTFVEDLFARHNPASPSSLLKPLTLGLEALVTGLSQAREAVRLVRATLQAEVAALLRQVEALQQTLTLEGRRRLEEALAEARRRLKGALRELESRLVGAAQGPLERYRQEIRNQVRRIETGVDNRAEAVRLLLDRDLPQINLGEVKREIQALLDAAVFQPVLDYLDQVERAVSPFRVALQEINAWPERLRDRLIAEIQSQDDLTEEWWHRTVDRLRDEVLRRIAELEAEVRRQGEAVLAQLVDLLNVDQSLHDFEAVFAELDRLVQQLPDTLGKLTRSLESADREYADRAGRFAEEAGRALSEAAGGALAQLPDHTLRLLRAFGEAPAVPQLDFNRARLAYYFDELRNAVDLTPVTALVDRADDALKALGIRLPTRQLLDRCIPERLENLDLGQIFPDFAGLKLDKLFPGVRLPALANDNVKVTHGADKQSLRAWLQAEVDVPMSGSATLFAFGPVRVRLVGGRFQAVARIEARLGGSPTRHVRAVLGGSWVLEVGGLEIVIFRDTPLIYEEGRGVRFDLSPDRVEVQGALRFLADLLREAQYSGSGLTIRLLESGGVPVGAESVLDLPLPDLSAGAFGIANLRLGTVLRLQVDLRSAEFTLSLHLFLGQKTAPFTLTIAMLTGGGWVDVQALYRPRQNSISTQVSVGIVAGASLAFAFGPIRGGVYLLFGLQAELAHQSPGPSRGLTLILMLLARGEVTLFGFVSVGISLLLEASYGEGGRLTGRGTLNVSVKISWCFTISASARVEYVFAQGSGRTRALAAGGDDPFQVAAREYINMLE